MIFRYGIPSYKRPQCKTVDMLVRAGVDKSNIYVSLQDHSQLEEYKAVHPDIHYIVRNADCAAGNRNTLMDELGAPIVLMDDDLSSVAIKYAGRNFKSIYNKDEWEQILEQAIAEAKENNCVIIGVAANTNDIIAKNRRKYDYDSLLQGSFLVVLEQLRFDESWKAIDDYELSLRVIANNRHTLRINTMSACKRQNCTNQGGCYEVYKEHPPQEWIFKLERKYPFFKANKTYTGGSVNWT